MKPIPPIFKVLRWLWRQPAVQGLASLAVERLIKLILKAFKKKKEGKTKE